MQNITLELIHFAEQTPDADAILFENNRINYRQLNLAVWRYAQFLHTKGVRAGDIVGVTINDELRLVIAVLALARLGVAIFSVARSATLTQRDQMLDRVKLQFFVVDITDAKFTEVPLILLDAEIATKTEIEVDTNILALDPQAPCLLIYGSGTTGIPKIIPVTHQQIRARAQTGARALSLRGTDRITTLSHFDFSSSKYRLCEALMVGAAFAIRVWNNPDPIAYLKQLSISVVHATVFHTEILLSRIGEVDAPVLNSVRAYDLTSSTVNDRLRQRIRSYLCHNLSVRYGCNESGLVSISMPHEVCDTPSTIGRVLDGIQLQIVDNAGHPVPTGEVGLIQIRCPGLINGYWGNPDVTEKYFHNNWFVPGDLGKISEDGQLIYLGRADYMMILNGINIYPEEIEQMMALHPQVRDTAVVPLLHQVHQDLPICAVALFPGQVIEEQALLQFAKEKLGAYGPARVLIFDEIPRNDAGKLNRNVLLQMIRSRLFGAIN